MDEFLTKNGLGALRGKLKQECFDLPTLLQITPEVAAELIPHPVGLRVKLLHSIEKHKNLNNPSGGNNAAQASSTSKNLGEIILKAAFAAKKALGFGYAHGDYWQEFGDQLEKLDVDFEEGREFWWGTPNVYVHCYGPVEIVSTVGGIDEADRDRAQDYANGSNQKCTLINFGTRNPNPVFEYYTADR